MSVLIDDLTASMGTLLASGQGILASTLRQFQAKVIAAIAVLEARARGNRIFYTRGVPADALGMEGDLGVNKDTGDFFEFTGGTFVFLFNGRGGAGDYRLPQATTAVLGGVKSMGAGLAGNVTVNPDGSMTAPANQGGGASNFSQLSGAPGDNAALASVLATKADLVGGVVSLSQLPPPLVRLTYVFPAGQTSTYECPIVFLSQAGSYRVEQQNGVKAVDPAPAFYINGVPSAPPYNVALGDTLSITAATPAGQKGFIILRAA